MATSTTSVCASDALTRIAIADVMGHGEAVSEVSQFIYDALGAHMNDASGDELLKEVNAIAAERGIQAMTTAAVVAFFKENNHLFYAYAGHYPVLVKRKGGSNWSEAKLDGPGAAEPTAGKNLPLAVMSDTVYTQDSMPLASGDRLFLYTDGVIEAFDPEGELFGKERLKEVLEERGDAPLPELSSSILDALRKHTGGELDHDDVTFIALEIR